jgi:hypothetical protein
MKGLSGKVADLVGRLRIKEFGTLRSQVGYWWFNLDERVHYNEGHGNLQGVSSGLSGDV